VVEHRRKWRIGHISERTVRMAVKRLQIMPAKPSEEVMQAELAKTESLRVLH
jgi:hypothetical protein